MDVGSLTGKIYQTLLELNGEALEALDDLDRARFGRAKADLRRVPFGSTPRTSAFKS